MKLTEAMKRYSIAITLVLVAGSQMLVPSAHAQTPVPMCSAQNILGFPYSGLVCGGSVIDNCTPGALYQCVAGLTPNNCTLAQACAVGCLTGPTSTSITLNTSAPTAADACFAGPPPLTLSTNSTLGGNDVTLTATLTEPHSPFGAGISLLGNASLVAPLCNGSLQLAADATTLSFDRPTSVVSTPTDVPLSLLIGYIPDPTTGKGRTLVSTPTVLTLNPGGVQLPASVSSFTLNPSTIPAGGGSSIALTMTRASTTPNQITVTSSNPSVAFSREQPGPTVFPGCTTASGAIWSASFVPDTTAVTIGASAQGQVPVTNLLTVTASPLALSSVTLNPFSAVTGGSSVGTVTLNKPAPAGGIQGLLSGSPGILTGASLILPPSVTIPEGQTSGSFTATVPPLTQPDSLWIVGDFPALGSRGSIGVLRVSPVLTVYSIKFDPDIRIGGLVSGTSATATLTLYAPAPVGGAVVALGVDALNSQNPAAVTLPASVTVPEGATSASFTVKGNSVPTTVFVRILATLNGFPAAGDFDVDPVLSQVFFGATVLGGTSTTGTVTLRAPAPPGGAFVPLSNSNPAQVTVPASVTVPAGATSVTFTANTSVVPSISVANISAFYDGATVSGPLFFKPPSISNLFLTPSSVVGGNPSTGTVMLDFPAVAGGSVVTLSSDQAAATVPPSITVPAGATSATFTVTTVPANVFAIITATLGTFMRTGLSVTPPPAPPPPPPGPVLSTVSLSPTSVLGGASSTGTVTLSAPAPSGGGSVSLSCSSTSATVPVSITVPAGATSATFTVTTTSVTASTSAIVNAGYGGVSKSATLTVNPGAPAAPSLLSPAVDATPAQPVTFDWSDVTGATSYEIQVDDSQTIAAPFVASATVTVSQATIGGLPAKRLWWRVRAQNSAGFGPFSATRRFTPQAAPAAASLSAVSVSPASVVGGASSTGTVTLTAAAPTGGAVVTLTSSNVAATAPANVTVAAGSTSASFTVTTTAVTVSTSVTITASFGGVSKTALLTVSPPGAPPPLTISGLALNPTSVVGGNSSVATVTLSAAAPAGGAGVTLSSNNTAANVPLSGSVTVAAGTTSATFTVTTVSVTASASATISASFGGVTKTALLSVTPPAPPPSASATLTVTATGRTGERVSSSPAGISVAVGSTGSAAFATGTSITLSVSNARDAIWSGACSSAGARAKTCTFTLTANASVTANVQ